MHIFDSTKFVKAISAVAVLVTGSSSLQMFTSRVVAGSATVTGAAFSVSAAPAPIASISGTSVNLSWPQVTLNSGAVTSYYLERLSSNSPTVNVCSGMTAPVANGATMTCRDSSTVTRSTYSYREQVQLVRNGISTWTVGPSAVSQSLAIPTITYSNVGPSATTPKNGSAVISYPASTTVGDLMFLVISSSKNSEPPTPTGWTKLAAVGFSGTTSLHLLIAWKIADGGAQNIVITSPNNGAYSTGFIFRYQPWPNNSIVPSPASVAANVGHSTTGAVPGLITTTSGYATAFSVVALPGSHDLSLSQANSFVNRHTQVILAGSEIGTIGIADSTIESNNALIAPPTWATTQISNNWLYMTFAFA